MDKLFFNGVFTLIGIALAIYAGTLWVDYLALQENGITTEGQVIDSRSELVCRTHSEGGENCHTDYYISYQFQILGDTPHTDETRVDRSTFNSLHDGDPVNVIYLADDPDNSYLEGDSSGTYRMGFTAGAVVWLLVTGYMWIRRD